MDKNQNQNSETQKRILDAARQVFIRKGFAAARMQEIADEAEINKALLHYYFRSKDKLFDAIFTEIFSQLLPIIITVFNSEMPIYDKIRSFFELHISVLQSNPYIPNFILTEISANPERIKELLKASVIFTEIKFSNQLIAEIEKDVIRDVKLEQLIVNMLALSVFPFVAKPLIQGIFGYNEEQFLQFIEERKKVLPEFVINSLLVK